MKIFKKNLSSNQQVINKNDVVMTLVETPFRAFRSNKRKKKMFTSERTKRNEAVTEEVRSVTPVAGIGSTETAARAAAGALGRRKCVRDARHLCVYDGEVKVNVACCFTV